MGVPVAAAIKSCSPLSCVTSRERKRAEEERAYMAAIIESSEDAIISKTLDGTITGWNMGAERLYGYSSADAIGRSISILIPPDRREELSQIRATSSCCRSRVYLFAITSAKDVAETTPLLSP